MVGIRGYLRLALIGAATFSTAVAYTLWLNNAQLKKDNLELTLQVQMLNDARTRDAAANDFLRTELEEENDRLNQQLLDLSEITDAEGTEYLSTPVPDSVRQLFR